MAESVNQDPPSPTDAETHDDVRAAVRAQYGDIARGETAGCCAPGSCDGAPGTALGYSAEAVAAVPEGVNLGLGCGNPGAIASLTEGETVLDLGAGPGFDCFLAAAEVGPTGRVIGVDMTPDMVSKARANAARLETSNVEFRLGEIERLPVADGTVDIVMSNCVINLSPDKAAVFREAFRVLRPGGRLAIADVVSTGAIPDAVRSDIEALSACVSGAASMDAVRGMLVDAGFDDVRIAVRQNSDAIVGGWMPGADGFLASATIEATKPGAAACCAPMCCDGTATANDGSGA